MKKIGSILIIVIIIAVIVVNYYLSHRTVFIDDVYASGNTGGNLNNSGLFCEYEDKVYFSNYLDNNTLYVVDENNKYKKLHNSSVAYINVLGKYIYYSRQNYKDDSQRNNVFAGTTSGVYRINKNGNNIQTLDKEVSLIVHTIGNEVYYQNFKDNNITLKKIKIDGTEDTVVSKSSVNPSSVLHGLMYYTGVSDNHYIHALDLATNTDSVIYTGNCANSVYYNGYIYFLDLENNYSIARVGVDGSNKEILVNKRCFTFNMIDDYLYYQIDDVNDPKICINSINGGEEEVIKEGHFNNINVTSNYVYFQSFNTNTFYQIPVGTADGYSIFSPPIYK